MGAEGQDLVRKATADSQRQFPLKVSADTGKDVLQIHCLRYSEQVFPRRVTSDDEIASFHDDYKAGQQTRQEGMAVVL